MIALNRTTVIAVAAVAVAQSAAIGWMIWDRVQLLKHGREIVLPIVPVDPRSLFRGDYVILSYPVSTVPGTFVTDEMRKQKPQAAYITLAKTGDEWQPTGLSLTRPQVASDQIVLKGRPRFGWWPSRPNGQLNLRYGIESYFVPEGTGRALEKLARDKKLAALVAVDARGNAAIKGLMIDGTLQYEEPLL